MLLIVQSFAVYLALALALFSLGMIATQREAFHMRGGHRLTFWTWEIILSLLLFAFISGVRWNVGVDYQNYLREYFHAQIYGMPFRDFEIGFTLLTKWMAEAGIHYSFYFGLLAFLQLFFVYRAFKNERYLLPFIGLVVILGAHYLSWMNGIRQMLAATMFLYSVQFIYKRKWVYYFAVIFFASLFHKSALILLPLYFIPTKDYFLNRWVLIITTPVAVYIGNDPTWLNAISSTGTHVLGFLDYTYYMNNLESIIERSSGRNLGPRRLTGICIFLMIAWYSCSLKEYFSRTYFQTYFNLSVIGFFAYNLLANANHVFLRPVSYLTIFSLPVSAYLLVYLYRKSGKNVFPFAFALLLSCAYTPLSVIADHGLGDRDFSNYRFFFFHEE